MAKEDDNVAPEYGYGGADGEANKLAFLKAYGLPIIYRDDGTLDMQAASQASAARPSSGIQVFGGVGGLEPTVDNPTEVPEFAGGMPDIITNPTDPFDPTGPTDPEDPFAPPPIEAGAPPGSGNLPPPEAEPGVVEPWTPTSDVDKSWNWDYFQPKSAGAGEWGGYDQDYGVFERYQPGQDSPWGMPDIEGGNKEFYQQQFANLLRDEQGFQNRERDSQRQREFNDDPANQSAPINYDDMWASMGILPSQATQADADGEYSWSWSDKIGDITAGQTTNYEIYNQISDKLDTQTRSIMDEYFGDADSEQRTQTRWGWSPDAATLKAEIGEGSDEQLSTGFRDALNATYDALYTRNDLTTPIGGGPTAAVGYASPITGNRASSLANVTV